MFAAASVADQSREALTRAVPAMPTKADDPVTEYEPSTSSTTTFSLLSSSSLAHSKSVPSSVATGNIFQTTVDHSIKQHQQHQQPYQQPKQAQQEIDLSRMTEDQPMEDATPLVMVGASTAPSSFPSKPSVSSTSDASALSSIKESRQPDIITTMDGPQPADMPDQQLSGDPVPVSGKADDANASQRVPLSVGAREREGEEDDDVNDDPNGDDTSDEPHVHTAVFRPQLDDIMLDQDLLDFYQRLKELVSRSPLKTAQALYAFSAATSHLEIDLMKPSVFNMYHRTFAFHQDNTWFTVDLESHLEEPYSSDLESDPRIHILPTRHKLFPAPKQWNDTQNDRHPSSSSSSYSSYLDSLYSFSPSHLYGSSHKSKKRRPSRERSPSRLSRYDEHERSEMDVRRRGRERDREDRSSSQRQHWQSSTSPSRHREGETSTKRTRTDSTNDDGYGISEADLRHSRYLSADGQPLSHEERRRLKKKLKKRRREEAERMAAQMAAAGTGAGPGEPSSAQSYGGREAAMANGDALQSTYYSGSQAAGDANASNQQQSGRPLKLVVRPPPQQPSARGESGSQTPQTPVSGQSMPRSILPSEGGSDAAAMRPPSTTPTTPKPDIPLSPHQIRRKGKHIGSAYSLSSLVPLPEDAAARNHKPGAPPEEKLKKGTWTSQEEEMLLEAVRELSSENWHAVAARVPGRNAKQCMQKWQTDLDPQINRLPWTIDEDQRLVEAYQAYGNSWQQIAKVVETRTWYQCYNRVRAKSVKSRIMNAANFAGGSGAGGTAATGSGDAANGSTRGGKLKDTSSGHNRGASGSAARSSSRDEATAPTSAGSRDADKVVVVKQEDGGAKSTAMPNVSGPSSTSATPASTHSQSPLSTPITPSSKFMPATMSINSAPGSSPSTSSAAGLHSSATTPTAPGHSQFGGSSSQSVDTGRALPPSHHQQQQHQQRRSERDPPPSHSSGRDPYHQHHQTQASKPSMEHGQRPSYSAPSHHHSVSNQPAQGGSVSGSPTSLPTSRMNQGQAPSPVLPQQQHSYQQQQQYLNQTSSTSQSPHLQHTPQQRPPHTQGPPPPQSQQQRPVSHQSPQIPPNSSHEMSRPAQPSNHANTGSQGSHSQQQQQGAQGYHPQGQQGHGHGHSLSGAASSPHQGYQSNQASSQHPRGGPQHSSFQQHPTAQTSPRQQSTQMSPHLKHQQQQQQPAHNMHMKTMSLQQQQQPQPAGSHHRHNSGQGSLLGPQQQQSGYFPPVSSNQLGQGQRPSQSQQQQAAYQSQDPQQRRHTNGQNTGQGIGSMPQQQQRSQPSFQPPPAISTAPGSIANSSPMTTPRGSAPPGTVPGGAYASPHRSSILGPTSGSSDILTASPTVSMAAPSPPVPSSAPSSSKDGGPNKPNTAPFSIPMPSPSMSGLPPQLSPGSLAFVPTSQLLKMTKSMQSPSASGFPPSSLPLRSPVSNQPSRPLPSSSVQNMQSQQQQQQQQQQPGQGPQQQPTSQGMNSYFQGSGRDH